MSELSAIIVGLDVDEVNATDILAQLSTEPASWTPDPDIASWWLYAAGDAGYLVGLNAPDTGGRWAITDGAGTTQPTVTAEQFTEIRIFTPGHEILVTRDVDTAWVAHRRRATDAPPATPCSPRTRTYLLGRRAQHQPIGAFATRIVDAATGTTTVIPIAADRATDTEVSTVEYFAADPASGAVRVAAVCWQQYTATPAPGPPPPTQAVAAPTPAATPDAPAPATTAQTSTPPRRAQPPQQQQPSRRSRKRGRRR